MLRHLKPEFDEGATTLTYWSKTIFMAWQQNVTRAGRTRTSQNSQYSALLLHYWTFGCPVYNGLISIYVESYPSLHIHSTTILYIHLLLSLVVYSSILHISINIHNLKCRKRECKALPIQQALNVFFLHLVPQYHHQQDLTYHGNQALNDSGMGKCYTRL